VNECLFTIAEVKQNRALRQMKRRKDDELMTRKNKKEHTVHNTSKNLLISTRTLAWLR